MEKGELVGSEPKIPWEWKEVAGGLVISMHVYPQGQCYPGDGTLTGTLRKLAEVGRNGRG